MKSLLTAFTLFLSIQSFAGEGEHLALYGRSYTNSCGYFSNVMGDYRVQFQSVKLQWGSKVTLIYGWKGYNVLGSNNNQNFNWAFRNEVEMKATSGYTWEVPLNNVNLHSRSSNQFLTGLQFVLKVEMPGSSVRYIKGNSEGMSYFQAPAQLFANPCVDAEHALPEFTQVPFHIAEK